MGRALDERSYSLIASHSRERRLMWWCGEGLGDIWWIFGQLGYVGGVLVVTKRMDGLVGWYAVFGTARKLKDVASRMTGI